MLNAAPKGWFTWDYQVREGEQPVADVHLSLWGEKGRLSVDGASYEVRREGWVSGAFVLEADGAVLARAAKPSAFCRSFVIEHGGAQYSLRAKSAFGRAFALLQGTRVLGSVSPQGLFSRRARVDLPDDLPLPLRMFVVWLALILWRRAANAATAGAT